MMLDTEIKTATENWLTSFVIHYNICPFALREHVNNRIRYTVSHAEDFEAALTALMEEIFHLDANPGTETTLLIFARGFLLFDDYLDLVALAEQLLNAQGYEGIYQIASFHPDYCFSDVTEDEPSNYTNRSPFPMLHLIRENSLAQALSQHPNPEHIPNYNIALTRELGAEKLRSIFLACLPDKASSSL